MAVTQRGQKGRSGRAALISERKSRVKGLLLRQLAAQLRWRESRRTAEVTGEREGEVVLGVKIITL